MRNPIAALLLAALCSTALADPKADQRLRDAVLAGDAAEVTAALKAGGSPDAETGSSSIALEAAVLRDLPVLTALKEAGVDFATVKQHGWNILNLALVDPACSPAFVRFALDAGIVPDKTYCPAGALSTAAAANNAEIAAMLIDAGAGLNRFEGQDYSPLETAVVFGSPEVVKLLIKRHADDSVMPKGQWNLYHCLNRRHRGDPLTAQIAKAIGENDDPDAHDASEWTPLMWACYSDNFESAKAIIAAGAVTDGPAGAYALITAALHSDDKMVALLLDKGAPVNKDWRGMGAICAVLYGSDPLLLSQMRSTSRANKPQQEYATSIVRMARSHPLEKLKLLIAAGADVDEADSQGWTPLAIAARTWDTTHSNSDGNGRVADRPDTEEYLASLDPVAAARMLIDAGAKVHHGDPVDPIAVASQRVDLRREPMIKLLRETAAKQAAPKPAP